MAMLILLACALALPAWADKAKTAGDDLKVETYCWKGGDKVQRTTQSMGEEHKPEPVMQPEKPRRLHLEPERHLLEKKTGRDLLAAVWDRPTWRKERFELTAEPGEHPCFAGFKSMLRDTDRCAGWRREYPAIGGHVTFINTGISAWSSFQLMDVVAEHINVWIEEGSTPEQAAVAQKAAKIYANVLDVDELKPVPGSDSWMTQECKVMGPMPFMYSCSDRINILVQNCGGTENAWVRQSDYLVNFPKPCNNESYPNNDIVFYMCQELLDRNPNPYAAANTFAHELAHVIQGGFGSSFYPMTEGGATWLEGSLLRLAPRPMVYAWGFRSWDRINAAHFYATTKATNARKFYQIHAMFLTYLSQDELLGDAATSALQNYQSFNGPYVPWGRASYDYFLSYVGKPLPETFEPVIMDVKNVDNPFATALLDFRVAIAAQCIADAKRRPSEARYLMPAHLRDRPFWDCSTFQTFWSADQGRASSSMELHYGGAAMYRLAAPEGCKVEMSRQADHRVRTKILAAGTASGLPAEVRELAPGESTEFDGEPRELFIVQVNVDPEGEVLSAAAEGPVWQRARCRALGNQVQGCKGSAWTTGARGYYRDSKMAALRLPLLELPEGADASLSFRAWWDLEATEDSVPEAADGCPLKGYDGVQVRAHVYHEGPPSGDEEADEVVVLQPEGGYGTTAGGRVAVAALASPALTRAFASLSCEHLDGWTGQSSDALNFSEQKISLAAYAGKAVRVEIVFASDQSANKRGFWLNGLRVRAGGKLLLKDTFQGKDDEDDLVEHIFVNTPKAGAVGPVDGVPVLVQYPEGYEADKNLMKAGITRSATWFAAWRNSSQAEAALRRQYLGWSYAASTYDTITAILHPWQEACVQLQASISGAPVTATLFTLVDKIGITSVSLIGRSAVAPYVPLSEEVKSSSEGVTDPGVHRFVLGSAWLQALQAGQNFLLCVRTGEVKALPSDGEGGEPFVHLPLTNVSTAATKGLPGWTVIRDIDDPMREGGNLSDPWDGHSMSLRVEYSESANDRRLQGQSPTMPVLV
eukprot:TRINITY_DN10237_c0_g1_i2.p1 TRINITY_DN10237_c0_g1~~TRINITY_DN10237_c0_g1_i2.p1  ORF type:complete len:1062 (+),score=227.32 TRINITY_DN10237_c0_g1_i2:63-3188(+)